MNFSCNFDFLLILSLKKNNNQNSEKVNERFQLNEFAPAQR